MSVSSRIGQFGSYYGNTYNSSNTLTQSQMEVNARYIYSYLSSKGWSINAIAGLLGNMQHESALNPGRWQSEDVGNMSGGYGLVQWTPATNHINWCNSNSYNDPSEMDVNLAHIIYEVENNQQYYAADGYPESFKEFTKSTKDPYYLACAFAWNYERSYVVLYGSETEKEALRQKRGGSALYWYEFLGGTTPITPINPSKKKRKRYNFILFNRRRRMFNG